jgi:hypothetical protein
VVDLDDANERGEKRICVPASFGRFDHAYCLTNHKSQGRTFDAAYVMANPAMADREWTYVAASRSRFASTVYANLGALGMGDIESHQEQKGAPATREAAIDALALRMRRSRAKGTTLDYEGMAEPSTAGPEARAQGGEPKPSTGLGYKLANAALRCLTPLKTLSMRNTAPKGPGGGHDIGRRA